MTYQPRSLQKRSQGFTLLEITVAVAIASVLAAVAVRSLPDKIRRAKSDATIAQVMLLGEAAQAYEFTEGEWPDEVNNCAGAFAVLTNPTPAGAVVPGVTYVEGLDIESPWGTNYEFACVPGDRQFRLTVASTNDFSGYIANGVPAATVAADETTSLFPRAEFIPNLTQVLYRDNSGGVERNTMRTDLFMADTNDIIMGGGDLTGAQRIQAAEYANLANEDLIINDTFVGDGGVVTSGAIATTNANGVFSGGGYTVASDPADPGTFFRIADENGNLFANNIVADGEVNVLDRFSVGPLGNPGDPPFRISNVGEAVALALNTSTGDITSGAAIEATTEYRIGVDAVIDAAATFVGAGGVTTAGDIVSDGQITATGEIQSASAVQVVGEGGVSISDLRAKVMDIGFAAIGDNPLNAPYASVTKPDCADGFVPDIVFWPVSYSNDGVTDPIGAINMFESDSDDGGSWQISIELATAGSTSGNVLSAGFGHFVGYVAKCNAIPPP